LLDKLRKAKPWQRTAATVISFAISTLVWWFIIGGLVPALVIMACITLHELCHMLMFRRYGVKAGLIFILFLNITYAVTEEDFHWDRLSKGLWVTAAGVIGNCLLGFICLGLSFLVSVELAVVLLTIIALINFLLALLNLAPGFGTDGDKISRLIGHFLKDSWGKDARLVLIIADIVGMLGTQIMMGLGKVPSFLGILITILFGFDLFAKGMVKKAAEEGEEEETNIGELTEKEALIHAAIYLALVALSLLGLWLVPLPVV
jgi:Zn-dependent protease